MQRVTVALAAGLALLAVAIGLTLLHSPRSVAASNGSPLEENRIALATRGATYCQAHELLPARTSAIRLSLLAFAGPSVHVVVLAGGHQITSGVQGSGWTSRVVTVPLRALPHAVPDVTVCVSFSLHDEHVFVFGEPTSAAMAAHDGNRALLGRMWIEYLRPGTRSWASLAPTIVDHMALGRAVSGIGIVFLALALLVAIAVLTSGLALRELS
jgi:hypothetical protein